MATFNNFLQGVATQVTNTALKRVAGNLPGINNSYPYINNSSRGGESSDQLPLAPRGNFQHYTFPLDVMAEPGLGNKGHYMMFYINQQENVKIQYGGKSGSGTSITGTAERSTPSHLRKLNSKGSDKMYHQKVCLTDFELDLAHLISLNEFEKITNNYFYSLFKKAIRYKEILYEG